LNNATADNQPEKSILRLQNIVKGIPRIVVKVKHCPSKAGRKNCHLFGTHISSLAFGLVLVIFYLAERNLFLFIGWLIIAISFSFQTQASI